MSAELMRSYLDLLNEQEIRYEVSAMLTKMLADEKILIEGRLDEGMLQKIASLVLGGAIAIGAMTSAQAMEFFYYIDPPTHQLKIATDMNKVPTDAKFVFSVDEKKRTVNLVRDGQSIPVQTNPSEVSKVVAKCGGRGVTQPQPGIIVPKCGVTVQTPTDNVQANTPTQQSPTSNPQTNTPPLRSLKDFSDSEFEE